MNNITLSVALFAVAACGSSSAVLENPSEASLEIEVITSPEAAGAVTSTLIIGPTELVIVDGQLTRGGAMAVATAAEARGKTVSSIFITHAHPDHYLGVAVLAERFPNARVIATPAVVDEIKESAAPTAEAMRAMLGDEFPGEPVIPSTHTEDTLSVDGVPVRIMKDLAGDTHPIAALHIESLGALIASDIAYVDVHLWTKTTDHAGRLAWAEQADALAKLDNVRRVIPGHQVEGSDTKTALSFTSRYIRDFDEAVKASSSAEALIATMVEKYPQLKGALFLQLGAKGAFPAQP